MALLVMAATVLLVFVVGRSIGDPVSLMLPPAATSEQREALRESLGLNDPWLVQFGDFVSGLARGDMGESFWFRAPAMELVLERLPATFYLGAVVLGVSIPLAVLLGGFAAVRPRSVVDRIINILSLGAVSIVHFWLALLLVLVFAVQLGWFATSGYGGLRYIALPAAALALRPLGRMAQFTRSALLDEYSKPYITAARAKGMSEKRVFLHALKNAGIPVITLAGDDVADLVNGTVVIETIFSWPGIGMLLLQAIQGRDVILVQAAVLVVAVLVALVNLLVDLTYGYLDPKVRYA